MIRVVCCVCLEGHFQQIAKIRGKGFQYKKRSETTYKVIAR